mmetsp:Transcript_37334/g.79325  ORF Transcript_37334/g.79325 Transcript_37334/m.79325 type:complete len:550 (-) Transcript_37334:58-1707(-)
MGGEGSKLRGSGGSAGSGKRHSETQVGKVAISGRYHRAPKKISDDYEMTPKVLGSGYNGVVKMAVSKGAQNPQNFAVKAFKLSNLDGEKKAQLESEVDVFLGMDHPHVTRLFDVYESDGYLYLVMECMEGGELFDRVKEKKRFSEGDAARSIRQMLLAVNYLHSHGIVHRDLKLENFLYDGKFSEHLKLIDFGFSKVWDPNIKMKVSCGTLAYVAPEVLQKNYTIQCDMWSMGVIAFILLSGYMPFSGPETQQTTNIMAGKYTMKKERWQTISPDGVDFVKSLLRVDADKRLTAEAALQHPWIVRNHEKATQGSAEVDSDVVSALRQFGQASKFRRCCMEMMAWSLSNDERAKVRSYFMAMDKNNEGTITLGELKQVLQQKFHIPEGEILAIFEAMDSNNDESIHYSDFLAAMVSTRIALHGDLLRAAFKRFDKDNSGYITVENLRQVLGDSFEGAEVETLIKDADLLDDGRVSFEEFQAYLRGTPLDNHVKGAAKIIDTELKKQGGQADAIPVMRRRSLSGVGGEGASPAAPGKVSGNAGQQQCCVIG